MKPAALSIITATFAVVAHARAKPAKPDFHVGVSARGVQWVDPHVAAAGAQPLFQIIARRARLSTSKVQVLDRRELIKQLETGKVNLAYLSSIDYLEASSQVKLRPLARPKVVGRDAIRLLLLVRRGGPKRLQDLKGRIIGLQEHGPLGRIYLRVLMAREKLPPPERFFGQVHLKRKQQSAVLEVLLGEADAVLVADVVLEVMSQLNPRLKRKLVMIHASKRFPHSPIVVPASMSGAKVERLRRTLASLHKDPKGRQMLLTFHLDRLLPVQAGDYKDLTSLWREYQAAIGGETGEKTPK